MPEQAVRDVLHTAASAAAMPTRFLRPSQVVRNAQARPRWQKRLLSAVAAVAACLIITAAVPGARAFGADLVRGIVTMWSGMVGGTNASVEWIDPTQVDELIAQGQLEMAQPGTVYESMDEAAAAAGFRPVETSYPGADLSIVRLQVWESEDVRNLYASATYQIGDSPVYVVTMANLLDAEGEWQVLPLRELKIGDMQDEPSTAFETLKLGDIEAVSYQRPMGSKGTGAVVTWLQDGIIVRVEGWDAELVRAVAAATAR